MNNRGKRVILPDGLLQKFTIEESYFPPHSSLVGACALSEVKGNQHIVRIYQLLFNRKTDAFMPVQEMAAFSFYSRKELDIFLKKLPHFNGLEMLMLLNPVEEAYKTDA